jgi:hypothetical protein
MKVRLTNVDTKESFEIQLDELSLDEAVKVVERVGGDKITIEEIVDKQKELR